MEEKNEMNLIAKKAKLIEYQNQISWISSECIKIDEKNPTPETANHCELLRLNLLSIIEYLKVSDLSKDLTRFEKEEINKLLHLIDKKLDNMHGRFCIHNSEYDL